VKVTDITYMRRVNLGNYEHEELSMSAILEDGENVSTAMLTLKNEVHHSLGLVGTPTEAPKKEVKVPEVPKKEETKKETPKKEEKKEVELPPVIDKKEDLPETKEKKPKAKKEEVKPTPYERAKQVHKDLFANLLNKTFPGWSSDKEAIARAKHASLSLEGEDFLDQKGNILTTFSEAVTNLMVA
jgi:outer membrane biosynthesis protein TonB